MVFSHQISKFVCVVVLLVPVELLLFIIGHLDCVVLFFDRRKLALKGVLKFEGNFLLFFDWWLYTFLQLKYVKQVLFLSLVF